MIYTNDQLRQPQDILSFSPAPIHNTQEAPVSTRTFGLVGNDVIDNIRLQAYLFAPLFDSEDTGKRKLVTQHLRTSMTFLFGEMSDR